MTILTIWLLCGAATTIILVARYWTTIAPWAERPDYGSERAIRWAGHHRVLLLVALISGPVGPMTIALLAVIQSAITTIGNHGGFQ